MLLQEYNKLLCPFFRAKLAEWLASKGKAPKRPAMMTAVLSKTVSKVSVNVKADLQSQCCAESQLGEQCKAEPKNDVVTEELLPAAVAHDKDMHEAKLTTQSQTPKIMNTTLDLLEDSDADLPVDSQSGVDDVRNQFSLLLPHFGNDKSNKQFFS